MIDSEKKPAPPASAMQFFNRALQLSAHELTRASERFQKYPDPVLSALALLQATLDRGGKIVLTGLGKSGKIAQKISATLASTGSASIYLHPTEALHGDMGGVSSLDAVIALSHTGNTEEILKLGTVFKSLRIPVIGIGGNPQSQLSRLCEHWLDATVEQEACPHNLAPTTSTTLALAIGDAIAVALMELRGFDAASFARNHPGGSLGKRLHLRVSDILHKPQHIALLPASATMEQVIEASSRHNLGAVLITDSLQKLLGIITDGDIRRALKHKDRFFNLRAQEVMTQNPVTIDADALAYDALEKMEKRPSQIKELPVVDSDQRVVGLVRIHDLVKFF
jgi:arabinose-5-phosphate isomerase